MFWRSKNKLAPKEMLSKAAAADMPLPPDLEERLRNARTWEQAIALAFTVDAGKSPAKSSSDVERA